MPAIGDDLTGGRHAAAKRAVADYTDRWFGRPLA